MAVSYTHLDVYKRQNKGVAELMNKTYEELSKLPPIAIFEPEMDINEEEYITDDETGYEIKRENEKYVIRCV